MARYYDAPTPPGRVREQLQVYLDAPDKALLEELARATGLPRTEIFRRGLRSLAQQDLGSALPAGRSTVSSAPSAMGRTSPRTSRNATTSTSAPRRRATVPSRALVDTSALLALASRRDQYHARAVALARRFLADGGRFVGTSLVLGELHGHLRYRRGPAEARDVVGALLADPAYEWVDVPSPSSAMR